MIWSGTKIIRNVILALTGFLLLNAVPAYSEYSAAPDSNFDPSVLRIDEEKFLGAKVSGEYTLIDEKGSEFRLNDLRGKALILVLSYYSCNGVCPIANSKLKDILGRLDKLKLGENYRVLTLSFDRNDDVHHAGMIVDMADLHGVSGNGWKVAVMKNKDDIKRLTDSVGYRFFWSHRDKMFIHTSVFIFLSPEGRVVRYLYGSSPDVQDVRLAITEANFGRAAGSGVIDLVRMACYSYNFKEGRYTMNYPMFIGLGSVVFGISAVVIPVFFLRKRKEGKSCTKDY